MQRLRELGWIDGHNVAIEYRWGEGRNERRSSSSNSPGIPRSERSMRMPDRMPISLVAATAAEYCFASRAPLRASSAISIKRCLVITARSATVMAAVSERTKASLKVARERGKVFGGRNAQSDANAADAIAFAETLRPVIDEIVAAHGPNVSTHVIASELMRRRLRTRTGSKQWSAMQALRLLRRLGERTREAP